MSFAILPRLHFKGRFETDVCTANNDDVVRPIDPVSVAVRFGINGVPSTDDAFVQWMRGGTGRPRASWNYYGGNSCKFVDCRIVSVDRGSGLVTNAEEDQSIGGSVILGENSSSRTGIMVDLNPEGTWGTLIFANRMQVVAGGVTLKGRPTVAASRWLGGRNTTVGGFTGAAATWQACIPNTDLTISPGATGALADLFVAAMSHRGVCIRYCTYLVDVSIEPDVLLARFTQGESPKNPAVGVLVGSMGVWEEGDYASMPNGRLLVQQRAITWNHGDVNFGAATVAVDEVRQKAVVDLITAVPEIDATGTKLPSGNAELVIIPDNGDPPVALGNIPYDQPHYELGGGLVEVALAAEDLALLASGALGIAFDGDIALQEDVIAVDTDDRNLYFDQGEERTVTIRVLERGKKPTAPVTLRVVQRFNPEKAISAPIPAAARALEHPDTITTDGDGIARLTLRSRAPMLGFLSCFVDGQPDNPSPSAGCLINFRIFPADDYDNVPDADLDFSLIYDQVLRYYHVIYPAMARIFPLNDEQTIIDNAEGIRERMNPELLGDWGYMPRTREMSAGKRKLLLRWLAKVAPQL
jgi:hypothetical protein